MIKIYRISFICILLFGASTILKAQCTFTTTVPYLENFSGITTNNQLPLCWAASNPSLTCLTYTSTQTLNRVPCSPPSFASFSNTLGAHYFYTKGIYLNAGTTYSTSLWFVTEYYGYTNWTDLSILYGTAQNSLALTSIVSTNSAAVSPICKSLSGTFSVSSSGIYYCAIRATSNGLAGASYLSWDDFLIEAPCQLNGNSFSITASTNTLCIGQSVTLTASGNSLTSYNWSTGATGSVIVVSPNSNTGYSALGYNTITTCYANSTINIQVNPTPIASVFANKNSICLGESATLFAFAGSTAALNTFSWSNGATVYTTVVSPTATSYYSVTITNSFNCSSSAVQQIVVNPLPTITAIPASTFICAGDELSVMLNGANTYSWSSSTSTASGNSNPIIKQIGANEVITITGTDANGCAKTLTLNLNIKECAGLNEKLLSNRLLIFPNPSNYVFNVLGLNGTSTLELMDLEGNVIFSKNVADRKTSIDLSEVAYGLYFLKIKSGNEVVTRKIIKE